MFTAVSLLLQFSQVYRFHKLSEPLRDLGDSLGFHRLSLCLAGGLLSHFHAEANDLVLS